MSFDVSADDYMRFMGKYSEPLATRFADLAGVRAGQQVLDVGCGPGALTAELVSRVGADAVSAVEPSASFAAATRERLPGVEVRLSPAEQLPFPDGAFDAGGGLQEAHPRARLAIERAAQQLVTAQLLFTLRGKLREDAFIVDEGEREAPAVGVELGGSALETQGDRFGELNRLRAGESGEARGCQQDERCPQRNSDSTSSHRRAPSPSQAVFLFGAGSKSREQWRYFIVGALAQGADATDVIWNQ